MTIQPYHCATQARACQTAKPVCAHLAPARAGQRGFNSEVPARIACSNWLLTTLLVGLLIQPLGAVELAPLADVLPAPDSAANATGAWLDPVHPERPRGDPNEVVSAKPDKLARTESPQPDLTLEVTFAELLSATNQLSAPKTQPPAGDDDEQVGFSISPFLTDPGPASDPWSDTISRPNQLTVGMALQGLTNVRGEFSASSGPLSGAGSNRRDGTDGGQGAGNDPLPLERALQGYVLEQIEPYVDEGGNVTFSWMGIGEFQFFADRSTGDIAVVEHSTGIAISRGTAVLATSANGQVVEITPNRRPRSAPPPGTGTEVDVTYQPFGESDEAPKHFFEYAWQFMVDRFKASPLVVTGIGAASLIATLAVFGLSRRGATLSAASEPTSRPRLAAAGVHEAIDGRDRATSSYRRYKRQHKHSHIRKRPWPERVQRLLGLAFAGALDSLGFGHATSGQESGPTPPRAHRRRKRGLFSRLKSLLFGGGYELKEVSGAAAVAPDRDQARIASAHPSGARRRRRRGLLRRLMDAIVETFQVLLESVGLSKPGAERRAREPSRRRSGRRRRRAPLAKVRSTP